MRSKIAPDKKAGQLVITSTISPAPKLPELPGLDQSRSGTFYGVAFLLLLLFINPFTK